MTTHFAPPGRLFGQELEKQTKQVLSHPAIDGMLHLSGGMLAILNSNRQVVALNEDLAAYLGIENCHDVFGLRPGEALSCIYSEDMPAGCGTGSMCSSCKAAIAIVTSQESKKIVQKCCAIKIKKKNKTSDLFFRVSATPITIENDTFILLYIEDITTLQKYSTMKDIFFHDLNNQISSLVSVANLLLMDKANSNKELLTFIMKISRKIAQEVLLQKSLFFENELVYKPIWSRVTLLEVFSELASTFDYHPCASEKNFKIPPAIPDISIVTDSTLLFRVLNNMLINAFEATPVNDTVEVRFKKEKSQIIFEILNPQVIPPEITKRIFQRNISTKAESGRGLGTYSMKLLGENILKGKVAFHTSKESGTVFSFSLPIGNNK